MRIISRTVLILSIVSLLADVASEMLYPVIPVYLKQIGFSVLWIGILEGVAGFTAGISKGYFGKRSDERGLRLPFVKLGYLLSAVAKPLMATFAYPFWIFLVRTTDRLGKGVRTAARDAMLSEASTTATKARVFGFHRALDTVGAAIGPLLALIYLYFNPGRYAPLFYLAFIPGILSLSLLFLLKERRNPVSTLGKGHFFQFFHYWKIASPEYRKVLPGFLLFALFNSSDFFLLLITKETIGDQQLQIGSVILNADSITIAAYIFYNLVYALSSYPMGMLADRFGFKKTLVTGYGLFAVTYAGFAFQPSIAIIFSLFFLYGLYAAATEGVVKAWISNLSHNNNTATAIGLYTSCESIATLAASSIAGAIWLIYGAPTMFLCAAIVTLLVIVYFIWKIRPVRSYG